MNKILASWNQERLHFQKRYAEYWRKVQANPNNLDAVGHLNECCYILTRVFGLSPAQITELERFEGCGLTDKDLDDWRE